MAMMNAQIPANASIFYGILMQIIEFDIVDMGNLFYDKWFSIDSEEVLQPLYPSFELIGLESTLFLYNIGTMMLILASFPVLMLAYIVAKLFMPCQIFKALHSKLSSDLFWNLPLLSLLETYYMLVLCCAINLAAGFQGSLEAEKISIVFTLFFVLFVVVFPISVTVLLCWHYPKKLETKLI